MPSNAPGARKEGKVERPLEVALGSSDAEAAAIQLHALGLEAADFTLESIGGQQFASITPQGLDRLAQPIDRSTLGRERAALDIISGSRDEDDWLPHGIARRPDLAAPTPPGVAPTLAQPFERHHPDPQQALKDYIGGRIADGDAIKDIYPYPVRRKTPSLRAGKEDSAGIEDALLLWLLLKTTAVYGRTCRK